MPVKRRESAASRPDDGTTASDSRAEGQAQVRKISNVIYAQLKTRILSLKYQPGTLLTERALAEDLEVSRTPVREAIQRLAQEGWLRINARRNIQVREVTISDFGEVFQARRMIEPAAIDLAFSLGIAASLPWKLDEAMAVMGASRGDLYSFITADQAFHAVFFDALHNTRLSRMWKTLSEDVVWLGILAMGHDERRYDTVTGEHERIVEAVRRRLRRGSREAMTAHLDDTERRLMARVTEMNMDAIRG